jgi:hypothetical protein
MDKCLVFGFMFTHGFYKDGDVVDLFCGLSYVVVCTETYCVYDFFLVDVSNGVTIVHLIYIFFPQVS